MSNSLDQDQARHFAWVQTVPKGHQQKQKSPLVLNTKHFIDTRSALILAKTLAKVYSFGSNLFHLAKVLATKNSEPE